jgi:hypothetical protein
MLLILRKFLGLSWNHRLQVDVWQKTTTQVNGYLNLVVHWLWNELVSTITACARLICGICWKQVHDGCLGKNIFSESSMAMVIFTSIGNNSYI